jgi:serine phosphatase RsbU (regulator of sigma subunit)/PAS domain-containing protein
MNGKKRCLTQWKKLCIFILLHFMKLNYSAEEIARLALFPEQNPNPVIEADYLNGIITYMNPAAHKMFPEMHQSQMKHDLFSVIRPQLAAQKDFQCEVVLQETTFEQKIYFLQGDNCIRVYSHDITHIKKIERDLARLASFPEQNPNPVIELSYAAEKINYMNPAARLRFPELSALQFRHPLFGKARELLHLQKEFQCEVQFDGHTFEQKVYFLPDNACVRIYSHDITERKANEKKFAALATFPELNPSPIIETDVSGNITYTNPAARQHFPDLVEKGFQHPALADLKERFNDFVTGRISTSLNEFTFGETHYNQRAGFIHGANVIRVFSIDVTAMKKAEETIREKNKDITDSINYARKIQQAILPSVNHLYESVPQSFILYLPRDIISGDFYWFTASENRFLFACADCTGHGVPGALMSMIGSNFLSQIVNESGIVSPAEILTELDNRVRIALKQDSEMENRDGMDIALLSLDMAALELTYASANRPVLLIRDNELSELAPSKYPVGGPFDPQKKFAAAKMQLKKGDAIYCFSDGLPDQFGGEKGKKLMKKNFYRWLTELHELPMQEQKVKLFERLQDWKGDLTQVDDVLVAGFRF